LEACFVNNYLANMGFSESLIYAMNKIVKIVKKANEYK